MFCVELMLDIEYATLNEYFGDLTFVLSPSLQTTNVAFQALLVYLCVLTKCRLASDLKFKKLYV